MSFLNSYNIPLAGLKPGIHHYNFNVDNDFFAEMGTEPFLEGNMNVDLELEKLENLIIINFNISGKLYAACDRCTESFFYPIKSKNRIIYKIDAVLGEENGADDEIIHITSAENEINVSQPIYEFINLLVPLRIVHPVDKEGNSACNPEMINIIEKYSPENKESVVEIDPRWEALKKLKQ